MENVLCIIGHPTKNHDSLLDNITNLFLDKYLSKNTTDLINKINVYHDYIPLIDEDLLNAWEKKSNKNNSLQELTTNEEIKYMRQQEILTQFLEHDKIIFVSPMWNWSIPPMLKAYLDCILIPGKSFKYTENGIKGLLNSKHILHIQTSGGYYSIEPYIQQNFSNRYLKTIFNLLGTTQFYELLIEGTSIHKKTYSEIKNTVIIQINKILDEF